MKKTKQNISNGVKEIFKKYNIKPSKKLGQNFLIDKSVLKKIIQAGNLKSDDIILEIGPGLGILTLELAKRVKHVIAVEKDKKMCEILKNVLNVQDVRNVRIINADILHAKYKLPNTKYKLVANLPYYITSPVIRKFLETKNKPNLMILMVQKEVGQRIVAKPGKMSLLSVAVQFYSKPEIISYVSKKSFYPQPKVDSAILRIEPRISTNLRPNECEYFFELVRKGFSAKRKMLKNNLGIDIGSNARAQELSVQDWLKLFHKLDL